MQTAELKSSASAGLEVVDLSFDLLQLRKKVCCVCETKSYKEVCDDCSGVYNNLFGSRPKTIEDIRGLLEFAEPHQRLKLSRELNIMINGI